MNESDNEQLLRRAEDLAARCERKSEVTMTGFLTPAEQYYLEKNPVYNRYHVSFLLSGGSESCERKIAFFLPDYLEPEYFDPSEYICALCLTAHFGSPDHRDYMGALMGMGIERDRLGDIRVLDNKAWIFCLPGIYRHLLTIEKVGRCGVTAEECAPADVPQPEIHVKRLTFSVMSPRLDAVAAGIFSLSRTEAARQIAAQKVSLNYAICEKPDTEIHEGDVLSLRGSGKGNVAEIGGLSRKGRVFVTAELLR